MLGRAWMSGNGHTAGQFEACIDKASSIPLRRLHAVHRSSVVEPPLPVRYRRKVAPLVCVIQWYQ